MSAKDELEILSDALQNAISAGTVAQQSMIEEGLVHQGIVGAMLEPLSHMRKVALNLQYGPVSREKMR